MQLLQMLNRDYGLTILMITHDAGLAGRTGRTVVLADGKIVPENF